MDRTKTNGNAQLYRFVGNALESSERVYCCGTPPERSAYYPNIAWFCGECGEIWRRDVYEFEFHYHPIPRERWKVSLDYCPPCTQAIFTSILKELS